MIGGYIESQIGAGSIANGSGTVTSGSLADGIVFSGTIASGQIADNHFASGASIDAADWLQDGTFNTAERISGGTVPAAVCFNQSGTLLAAMASVSGRMPAIGIVTSNYISGDPARVFLRGRRFDSTFNFSGWMNQPVYVGASGQLVASGAPTASGNIQQIVGVTVSVSGMMVQVGDSMEGVVLQSGDIGSGTVTGQAGGGFFVIASGTVSTNDLGSGVVLSGQLGSGVIGRFHVASGQFAGFELGSGAIVSGRIASGQVGTMHIASGGVQSGNIASGQIGPNHIGSGAVLSGHVASGQLGTNHIASGQLTGFELGSGAIVSGRIASGQVGFNHVASGQISDTRFTSGATIYNAFVAGGTPVVSGTNVGGNPALLPPLASISAEIISGNVAVCFDQSGNIMVAKAATSGRWPAVGVSMGNSLSGLTVQWSQVGSLQMPSGMADYSGYGQRRVWLGRSGQITTISGSWSSGGFASGDVGQPIGVVVNSGGFYFNVIPVFWSGSPLGVAAVGTF